MLKSSNSRWMFLLPLLAVLIWSVNVIVTKFAVDVIPAWSISFYRWLLAFMILTPFVGIRVWRQRAVVWAYLPKLAVLGLLGMLAYQGLMYQAAHSTSATNIGILNAMIPIFTVMIAVPMLGEKATWPVLVGSVLSFVGIMILISQGQPMNLLQGQLHVGDVLMLLAVICYAMYGVLTRLWHLPLDLLTNIYLQIVFGLLFHVPIMFYQGLAPLSTDNIWAVVYAGIFPSIIAPLLWVRSIQVMGASQTSVFINFLPLITALIAVNYLGEHWHIYHSAGAMMVLCGVILAQMKGYFLAKLN